MKLGLFETCPYNEALSRLRTSSAPATTKNQRITSRVARFSLALKPRPIGDLHIVGKHRSLPKQCGILTHPKLTAPGVTRDHLASRNDFIESALRRQSLPLLVQAQDCASSQERTANDHVQTRKLDKSDVVADRDVDKHQSRLD